MFASSDFLPNATNSVKTTSTINNGGLATTEECELDFQARTLFKGFTDPIDSEDIHTHFQHPTTSKKLVLLRAHISRLHLELANIERLRETKSKSRNTKNNYLVAKKNYNKALNPLLSCVLDSSPLRNLLFINEQLKCVSKRDPRVREHVDFIDPFGGIVGKDGENVFVLHTRGPSAIGGSRTEFDTHKACLSAMRACIELCVDWKTHVVKVGVSLNRQVFQARQARQVFQARQAHLLITPMVEVYGCTRLDKTDLSLYALKIPFVGSEYWISSDDPRLRHILCGGNPPRVDIKTQQRGRLMSETDPSFCTLYPYYAEFLRLVKAQLKQIVRNSHDNDLCPITIIPCCRIEPVCSGETYTLKVQRGGSKLVVCGDCRMDLCASGCGRVYHGNGPCTVSLDEASEAFIQESSKRCPNPTCGIHVHKTEGCNHMTCRCGCEFCWLCGVEMPRNSYGRYDTAGHFGVSGEGVRGIGCRQFS